MRIDPCYFCSRPCYPSKGITFVRLDGRSFRFCRSKCHKNFKMKRNPRKLAWTKAFRSAHGKEMVVDSTLKFAARRNTPVRYNRDLVAKTLEGMERVAEVRKRREKVFYMKRMEGNKARQRAQDKELVEQNQHLLPPEERTVVPEATIKKSELKQKMEELRARQKLEEMEIDEMEQDEQLLVQPKEKKKQKLRLVRGVGPETMDVDG